MLRVSGLDDDAQRARDFLSAPHRFSQGSRDDQGHRRLSMRMPGLRQMRTVADLPHANHLYRTPRFITRSTFCSRLIYRRTSPRTAMMSAYFPSLIVPTSRSTFIATAGQYVAARMAVIGSTPNLLTHTSSSFHVAIEWNFIGMPEIGRASCRERGEISVAAGTDQSKA